jgi:hypothetical protein
MNIFHTMSHAKNYAQRFVALSVFLLMNPLFAQTTVNTATVTKPAGLTLTCTNGPAGTGLSYSSVANTSCSAIDTNTLLAQPTITKSFAASTIGAGGTSVLTITVANSNTVALTGAAFTDTFPVAPGAMTATAGTASTSH